jgi:hypothetical protein
MLACVAFVLVAGCDNSGELRYRLTVEADVEGEVKSASSVINVGFYGGGGKNQPNRYYSNAKGVAAVIDLGRHGWLIAALQDNGTELSNALFEKRWPCARPVGAAGLPSAFGKDALELTKVREGKRVLTADNLPAFIWMPRDEPYINSRQLCPEQFARAIGADVRLKSVTIELAPDAPFTPMLDIKARWLDELREDQRDGTSSRYNPTGRPYAGFYPYLHHLESPGVPK